MKKLLFLICFISTGVYAGGASDAPPGGAYALYDLYKFLTK